MRRQSNTPLLAMFSAILFLVAAAPARAAIPRLEGQGGLPTLAPLLREITPAVVNISVISRVPVQENPLMRDPFFRRFFNLPKEPPVRQRMSAGSGVIVDAEKGYILTNHHVIENGNEIAVTMKDRRRFTAKVIGSDPPTDIALLKIEAKDLKALRFGDSDALQVGDFVVAIGNPFGLGQTVTSGIVSALGRSGLNIEGYEDFVQTDASINPGNSGGALVDLKGRLIGINTAIIGPSGGNVGIGFAVPSRMARSVMDQLIRYGEVRRGRLGVGIQDLTPALAKAMAMKRSEGAVITQVEAGSPAARASIQPGDVVIAINGRAVRNSADLRNQVGLVPVGQDVELTLIRNGKELTIRAHLGRTDVASIQGSAAAKQLSGAVFQNTQRGEVKGVLATEVQPGSPAWRRGLRPKDFIVAVNRKKVNSVEQFMEALQKASRVVALNILRGNTALFVIIQS